MMAPWSRGGQGESLAIRSRASVAPGACIRFGIAELIDGPRVALGDLALALSYALLTVMPKGGEGCQIAGRRPAKTWAIVVRKSFSSFSSSARFDTSVTMIAGRRNSTKNARAIAHTSGNTRSAAWPSHGPTYGALTTPSTRERPPKPAWRDL